MTHNEKETAYTYTWKANTVAVVSDGSAVLGLGNIGPHAAMPVMEGKCVLFKEFGDINLEDISAPRCFEIEERLKEILDIPVFHDDQHGTAIVVLTGSPNSCSVMALPMSSCVTKKVSSEKIIQISTGCGRK